MRKDRRLVRQRRVCGECDYSAVGQSVCHCRVISNEIRPVVIHTCAHVIKINTGYYKKQDSGSNAGVPIDSPITLRGYSVSLLKTADSFLRIPSPGL